jgi:RNA polymerase sigma factor (sigma-70 family)
MIGKRNYTKEVLIPESTTGRVVKFHPEHLDDAMLWGAFKNGDDTAFITIFDTHARSLYNYGCKISDDTAMVKDTIQDLFADLLQTRSRLGETNAIRFYLFKALRRRLVRSKARRTFVFFDFDQHSPSHEFVLISEQVSAERKDEVSAALCRLSKKQQEAIFFRYYEALSYDQIADLMGLRKQSVYNLINGAIKALRNSLRV